jgi:hypothetical protein
MDRNLKMPIEEVDASELWEAYNSVRAESYCPRCGKRLGPQKTIGERWQILSPGVRAIAVAGMVSSNLAPPAWSKNGPQGSHQCL